MKISFKKIIVVAAALLVAGFSVSCAHDWNDRYHKPPGKAYGHYTYDHNKIERQSRGWNSRQLKSKRQVPQRYVYQEISDQHDSDNHNRRRDPH